MGQDAVTESVLNALINTNNKSDKTRDFETEFYHKDPSSLWRLASVSGDAELDDITADIVSISLRKPDEILNALAAELTSNEASPSEEDWIEGSGMSWVLRGDTVVVSVPSFMPTPSSDNDTTFVLYPAFIEVQDFARKHNVTRVLMDLSGNGGGYIISTYALQWYLLGPDDICEPNELHMTSNWRTWVESFGRNYNSTLDKIFIEEGDLLGDEARIKEKFSDLYRLMEYADTILPESWKGDDEETVDNHLEFLFAKEAAILALDSPSKRAVALIDFIKSRDFFLAGTKASKKLTPEDGWYLFNNADMRVPGPEMEVFSPPLRQYTSVTTRQWGKVPSDYSQRAEYAFCRAAMYEDMPQLVEGTTYDRDYWTDVAFVTDGTCGSACASITQNLQLYGKATAFTDTPMDVASFSGGNVEEYEDIWPGLNIAAHLGNWATFGKSDWPRLHEDSWVNKPIDFPTPAAARFNNNMAFAVPPGPDSLSRQFYLIPAHMHFNLWARNRSGREAVYAEITGLGDWTGIRANPQWPELGVCPAYTDPSKALSN